MCAYAKFNERKKKKLTIVAFAIVSPDHAVDNGIDGNGTAGCGLAETVAIIRVARPHQQMRCDGLHLAAVLVCGSTLWSTACNDSV